MEILRIGLHELFLSQGLLFNRALLDLLGRRLYTFALSEKYAGEKKIQTYG